MPRTTCLAPFLTLLVLATIFPIVSSTSSAARRAASYAKYTTAHSLGSAYDFEARDGWSSVNVTNLNYKYRRDAEASSLAPRHPKDSDAHHGKDSHKHDDGDHDGKHDKKKGGPKKAFSASSVGGLVKGVTNSVFKGLKGIGKQEQVKITWSVDFVLLIMLRLISRRYTGHDLQNPSCWANTEWAPTVRCPYTFLGVHSSDLRRRTTHSHVLLLWTAGSQNLNASNSLSVRRSLSSGYFDAHDL